MTKRRLGRLAATVPVLAASVLAGCIHAASSGAARVNVTTVVLPASAVAHDSGTSNGTLRIIVRSLVEPGRTIEGAQVSIWRPGPRSADSASVRRWLVADGSGTVRRDSLAPGTYAVAVRSLGYLSLVLRATVRAGCSTWVEMYLGNQACDIGWCPPQPTPRATVTICGPAT